MRTSLGARFVVLTLSVVYRGCALPVAWTVLPANQAGCLAAGMVVPAATGAAGHPTGLDGAGAGGPGLVGTLALPAHWAAWAGIPAADHTRARSSALWARHSGIGCASWCVRWASVGAAVARPSSRRRCRLDCTLVAWWGEGYTDPWFLLTDPGAGASAAAWYGLRGWCEQGFKCFKRGGWQWQ